MPKKQRESSYHLSNSETKESFSYAKQILAILRNEIYNAKHHNPDIFTNIENNTTALSIDISEIIYQLLGALKLSLNKPLSINFGIFDSATNAFVSNHHGEKKLFINLLFLEKISKETDKGNGFEAKAKLRCLIAHELFHLYSFNKYPTAMKRSSDKAKIADTDMSPYILDLGERSADLFAIQHLRNQTENSELQRKANQKIADQKERKLKNLLRLVRIEQKLKSFFSKINMTTM